MNFPNFQQFRDSCLSQKFSFPMPIIKYMLHSSLKMYQKSIQCSKLLFVKYPILVMLNLGYNSQYDGGWKCCERNVCKGSICKHKFKIDMDKIHARIWLLKGFWVYTDHPSSVASAFIPKIHQCNLQFLKFIKQNLTYNELKFFASGDVKYFTLSNSVIKYGNGEKVPLEEVIKLFSGAKKVFIGFQKYYNNAACKNYDDFIAACSSIKEIELKRIPAIFDVSKFYKCLKRSKNRSLISIHSLFDRNCLNEIINEILATESFEFIPPVIEYFGQNETNLSKMKLLQAKEAKKYR